MPSAPAKGRIRSLLARALDWRVAPELDFRIDRSTDEADAHQPRRSRTSRPPSPSRRTRRAIPSQAAAPGAGAPDGEASSDSGRARWVAIRQVPPRSASTSAPSSSPTRTSTGRASRPSTPPAPSPSRGTPPPMATPSAPRSGSALALRASLSRRSDVACLLADDAPVPRIYRFLARRRRPSCPPRAYDEAIPTSSSRSTVPCSTGSRTRPTSPAAAPGSSPRFDHHPARA